MFVSIVRLFETNTTDFSKSRRVIRCKKVSQSNKENRVGQNHKCSRVSMSSLVSGKV
jgi:hypothetical protein